MKKKLTAMLLACTLAMGTLAGCGKSAAAPASATTDTASSAADANFNATGYPIVNQPTTLKVMLGIRDVDSLVDPAEMPEVKKLEEKTGIHVEWEVIKGSDWDTKLNLMFASGDYPDVILAPMLTMDDEEYGVTQQLLLPVDELTEQYMPTYTERIAGEESDPTLSLVASDGKKYSVGYLIGQNINTNQHYFINQTWLDNLGLSTPESADQLTEVLRAFKTQDPNGNGQNDEVPLEMGLDTGFYGIRYMLPMFGVPADSEKWIYIDDNKQVQFAATQDGFRDCMEWLNNAYKEGLVDPEIISQDMNTIEAKLKEGNVGFFSAWRLIAMGWDDGIARDAVLYTPNSTAKLSKTIEMAKGGAYVTVGNQNVPATMRWLDTMLDTETMFSTQYGEQDATDGTGWTYNENGKIDCLNQGTVDVKNFLDVNGLLFMPAQYYTSVFNMPPQRVEKTNYCKAYTEAGIMQKYSNDYLRLAPLTSDQLQSSALTETDIDNAVVENVATFITQGVTDDSWNAFVKLFDGMNVQDYVKMYQDVLDTMTLE